MERPVGSPRVARRRPWTFLTVLAVALGWLVVVTPAAVADGPSTFSNAAAITVPAAGSADQMGTASPYPSGITVSGLAGALSKVTVTVHGLTHSTVNDVDAMVVSPTGQNLVVLSDVGDPATLAFATDATLTFDDSAAGPVPTGNIPSGTYRPTNNGGADAFPSPAPAPSTETALSDAFTGTSPNGTWQLFVVDDTSGDIGTMSGGWSLTVTTEVAAQPTTTTVTTSDGTSSTGDPVTFTAAVTAGTSPVTTGSVQFRDGGSALGSPVALGATGRAALTTSALTEGSHEIRATYSGVTGFLTSTGTVAQRVDNPTVVSGTTFCNTGALTVPTLGTAQPYPSNVTVSGVSGPVATVTATVKGLSHQAPIDLDVMLSGPTPSQNLLLMSDSGGQSPVSGLDVTFDDAAASSVPVPLVSGTFTPTTVDDGSSEAFPAPAPAPSSARTLSTFAGSSPNGQWSLWVVDDASGDSGSIANGWCLTVTPRAATSTSLTADPNPSTVGDPVRLTATVTSSGSPVTSGSVRFTDDGSSLGLPVPVAADGTATLTTSALTSGSHPISAAYDGTATYAASTGNLTQVVETMPTATALTAAPNPSDPGQAVTFTATVTSGGAAVGAGTVVFAVDGAAQPAVPVDLQGAAVLTTSALTPGTRTVTATYSGSARYGPSAATLDQAVRPVADAGGPYTVAEGASLAADASGSTPGATVGWDLDDDGDFSDATGVSPTLTWAALEALGIDDGPADHTVTVRVRLGSLVATATATLQVTNTAPVAVVTGSRTATVGTPFTVKVGAEDPSSTDMAATFGYTVDWGDGSPIETLTGAADPRVTHTYATAGMFDASFTATDKDGGQGGPTAVQVRAVASTPIPTPTTAPTTTPTTTPTATPTSMPSATSSPTSPAPPGATVGPPSTSPATRSGGPLAYAGSDVLGPLLLGIALVAAGAVLALALRRRPTGPGRHG